MAESTWYKYTRKLDYSQARKPEKKPHKKCSKIRTDIVKRAIKNEFDATIENQYLDLIVGGGTENNSKTFQVYIKNYLLLFFLILLNIKSITSYSQHQITKHYTIEDGLASNYIYAILQDSRGFIWLATDNGVSRFDGKNFKNYNSSNGLPDNDVVDLKEDKTGRLWLSCYNGTPCYIKGNKIYTPNNDSFLKEMQFNNGYYKFISLGRKLCIAYSNSKGIEVDKQIKLKKFKFGQNAVAVFDKIIDVGYSELKTLRLFNNNYTFLDSYDIPKNYLKKNIKAILTSEKNKFSLFLNDKTCLTFEIINNKIVLINSIQLPYILSAVYSFDNQLWGFNEDMGIIPIHQNGKQDFSRNILFNGKLVYGFLKDKEGNFWGCSQGNGLFMISNKNITIYNESDGLYQNNILKLARSTSKELLLGFNDSQVQGFFKNNIVKYKIEKPKSISGQIKTLSTNKNYIVVGTHAQLIVVSKKTKKVSTIKLSSVKSSQLLSDDTLLVGTHCGCYLVKLPNTIFDTIMCGRTIAVYRNKKNEILVGNLKGLLLFKKNNTNKWIVDLPLKRLGIHKDISISAIVENKNRLLLGTNQKGILVIEGKDYQFIDLGDGLKNINCKSLEVDKCNNIWASSFEGIHKITFKKNIHDYTVKNYRKDNCLPYEDINDLKIINDTVYAACSNGLLKFPVKDKSLEKIVHPNIYITDVIVNNNSIVKDNPLNDYKIPDSSTSLAFSFSGIDFKSLGNIRYKYRLKGLNNNWQLTKENTVKYESLPFGTYIFEVIAINVDGLTSKIPSRIKITIDKHWWQRWQFIAFIALLVLGLVSFIVRYLFNIKHQKQLKEASLKKQIAEIELKAIKAQINPHFIFNTLNSIHYFIGDQKNEEAELYLSKLGVLLRKTLDFSSKSEVVLKDEIKYLDNYLQLEKLRFDEKFSYKIQNNLSDGDTEQIKIPPMVLQPHIENALKHSFQGLQKTKKEINIQFDFIENQLICKITDNGIGRKAALEKKNNNELSYTSKGIELSEAKLEMFEKLTGKNVKTEIVDLYLNEQPSGTKIIITINQNKND